MSPKPRREYLLNRIYTICVLRSQSFLPFSIGDTHRETSRDALLEFIVSTENLMLGKLQRAHQTSWHKGWVIFLIH